MFPKLETLKRIVDCGIIAVVRAENPEVALKIAEAVKAGGVEVIEITMTVPGAPDVIKALAQAYSKGEIVIGAGTVLDAATARISILNGAEFVVSPHLDEEIIRLAHRYQKVVMPGTMTVTEMVKAMEAGADIVKFFPGNLFGPAAVKAIRGPLPQVPLCPTGGVSLNNVADWIKAGVVAVGVGSELTKGAKTGDFEQVTMTARQFVEAIGRARA
ncbi:MAG: bifunctional 2-keto-4-hydroxyglutarate aldolase/2-keto-3-deoxy-6-phosphogluconate aldolase [Clostridia bacterium]|nr:bifunctional 2-keto-4-hydroxyglutarate aldolase/2-keto-3-deoxy-6-phosphogluconate aldolase [Clostridia bacterium]